MKPNVITYNCLIDTAFKSGNNNKVEGFINDM